MSPSPADAPRTISRRRGWLLRGGLVASLYVGLELAAAVGLLALRLRRGEQDDPLAFGLSPPQIEAIRELLDGRNEYIAHSGELGWTIKPGGAGGHYRANAQGLRADRSFATSPEPGVLRIAAFGDSFTHGDGVPGSQTWEEFLARLAPGVEVMNFGVPGYGVDQAYLRYLREGTAWNARVVVIGVMTENVLRHVNVFRPFYTKDTLALAKPRFRLAGDALELLPNPLPHLADYSALLSDPEHALPRLGAWDKHYVGPRPEGLLQHLPSVSLVRSLLHRSSRRRARSLEAAHAPGSEELLLTRAIICRFHDDVARRGSIPVVVFLPLEADLGSRPRYTALRDGLAHDGKRVIDAAASFTRDPPRQPLFLPSGHYAAAGNRRVALAVRDWLGAEGFLRAPAPPPGAP